VIASGAFGLGVSATDGLLGSEEQPAINPAARIATNKFFIIALSSFFDR
jgi:cobalamin biosynthesis protein CbiD